MSEIFDSSELMQQLGNDLEFLTETVEMLHEDSPSLMAKIRAAATTGDCKSLRVSTHTLKGMLGNFCAGPAFEAAAQLERMADSGDLSDSAEAFESLEREVSRLETALDEFLNAGRPDKKTSVP